MRQLCLIEMTRLTVCVRISTGFVSGPLIKTVFFVCFHVTAGWPEADMSAETTYLEIPR
jgi:hypothetical protein